ncbi:hypothetical protein [Sedimentitalea nanhaiensis]|jgi:hypothetical protein|uniref:Uncharacterized protein n=1 Tax=Sedimentitalea nanhaiensis TaxID=999627 RepID=A0A1I7DH29_9RHOB|nr:hypothetical protein [Sedimentitalea nanhaiensis]SFU10906.1 hypothetical protein SAMN05216236_1282 [Sedimentitalea nanhaiensis]
MFTGIMTGHDDVIGVACECKLRESDLNRMHGLIQERLQETSKPSLVLELTRLEAFKVPSALEPVQNC